MVVAVSPAERHAPVREPVRVPMACSGRCIIIAALREMTDHSDPTLERRFALPGFPANILAYGPTASRVRKQTDWRSDPDVINIPHITQTTDTAQRSARQSNTCHEPANAYQQPGQLPWISPHLAF
jgi:hypothetical protein